MQLGDIDIYDPDVYVGGVPHQAYAWLRKNAPVFFHPEPSGPGFWAVLRHADVAAVSKDPLTFSSARSGTQIADPTPEQLPLIRTMMLNLDPPQHGKVRAIVQAGFTPRMVARMAESLRARAAVIVEKAAAEGECEFVGDVAARLPLQVVAELMGVPEKDWQLMAAWGDRLVGFDDPEFDVTAEDALAASTEMAMYAISLAADRRGKKGDDLLTTLVNAKVDGRSLDDAELAGLFVQMTVAGNETTRTLISGGMLALCEHPQQLARLRGQPALIASAVEEMLRWVSPLHQFRRTATRDTEVGGFSIGEGDKVVLFYSSANRDEAVFEQADTFDVGRDPNPHLAFGFGEHFCLGAALARLEARSIFEALLSHTSHIEVCGPVRRLRSNQTNGIKEMRVRLQAA